MGLNMNMNMEEYKMATKKTEANKTVEKKTGDAVAEGEAIAVFYTNREETLEEAAARYLGGLEWGDTPPERQKLVLGVVTGA